jgi:hypothetical protein
MNVRDAASAAAQATPPVLVTGANVFGHPVSELVMYGTALYLVLQFIVIAPKVWRTIRGKT